MQTGGEVDPHRSAPLRLCRVPGQSPPPGQSPGGAEDFVLAEDKIPVENSGSAWTKSWRVLSTTSSSRTKSSIHLVEKRCCAEDFVLANYYVLADADRQIQAGESRPVRFADGGHPHSTMSSICPRREEVEERCITV
jgi:hypothetical protein